MYTINYKLRIQISCIIFHMKKKIHIVLLLKYNIVNLINSPPKELLYNDLLCLYK